MAMVKGLMGGGALTLVVSLVLGSQGSRGAFLNIQDVMLGNVHIWWSWPLFLASSGIAWGIMTMMK
jgi:hypothetical protein